MTTTKKIHRQNQPNEGTIYKIDIQTSDLKALIDIRALLINCAWRIIPSLHTAQP